MYSSFTEDARKILIGAKLEMKELKHPYVGSEHLLLSILKNDKDMKNKLKDYNLTYDRFRNEIIKIIGKGTKTSTCFLYTPLLKDHLSSLKNVLLELLFFLLIQLILFLI